MEAVPSVVEITGSTLLRISKLCRESMSSPVTGFLLGLDNETTLEVTGCYPYHKQEEGNDNHGEYDMEILRSFRSVGYDTKVVGRFFSMSCLFLGNDQHLGNMWYYLAKKQYHSQTLHRCHILLLFDPYQAKKGLLYIKALQLTESAMEYFKNNGTFDNAYSAGDSTIFVEIPIRYKNSLLQQGLLYDIQSDSQLSINRERLVLSGNTLMKKSVSRLCDSVDEYINEHNAHLSQSRRKTRFNERKVYDDDKSGDTESDRTKIMLVRNQVEEYIHLIQNLSSMGLDRLTILETLHFHNQ